MTRTKGITGNMRNAGDVPDRVSRRKKAASEDVNFAGWANFTIMEDLRDHFNQWSLSDEFTLDTDEVVGGGIKLSVGIDKDGKAYLATAFVRDAQSDNAGMMTSQRSGTAFRALAKLVYAIKHGMGEDWTRWAAENREDW